MRLPLKASHPRLPTDVAAVVVIGSLFIKCCSVLFLIVIHSDASPIFKYCLHLKEAGNCASNSLKLISNSWPNQCLIISLQLIKSSSRTVCKLQKPLKRLESLCRKALTLANR